VRAQEEGLFLISSMGKERGTPSCISSTVEKYGASFLRYWNRELGYCAKEASIVLCYFVIFETGLGDKGILRGIREIKSSRTGGYLRK